jgi:catechol 2,3-dioxygenase-like lactoylglutathione lyase family enzyme
MNIVADLNFVLLYVDSPAESATFYTGLLGRPPIEASPTFVMFALASGLMLGLWGRRGVQPTATAVGGSELAFTTASVDEVQSLHAEWSGKGVLILQDPTEMDFGYTFVAADPDGHRLRVFAPAA